MPKKSTHKRRASPDIHWAFLVAVIAIFFSFFLWTEVLLLRSASDDSPPVSLDHKAAEQPGLFSFHQWRALFLRSSQTALPNGELRPFGVLSIPKIGVHAPVFLPDRTFWDAQQWESLEEQMQSGLAQGAVAYPHSVRPGENGSVIIAGHSSPPDERAQQSAYGHLFRRLPELVEGDVITVLQTDGSYIDYAVRTTKIVPATETDILQQRDNKAILTLITCYPIGTTRDRWVVTAERIDGGR
jgi:LPXTG-site transpeptidase (sortase) family protein